MAKSKFSDIYKQELNSKGVMSSLGSAALKQTRERMDIRNSLFGGTGAISRTGQKIFGKGYSAMGGNAAKLSGRSNSPMQGASIDALVISNQKQERLLKIVAKNTMNMNMMARDMNITRQNIVSLTRKVTGKSAKGSDAMYMNANRRNAQVDGMPKRGAAPGASGGIMSSIFGGIGSVLSGGAGIIGSIVSGLLGVVGGVGGGILSAIGGILGGIPGGWLLGTIALAGIAYLLKEVAANTDFKGLKDDILKGLGFDPKTSFSQQLLVKMGFTEATSKNIVKTLSNFGASIYNYFVPILNQIGKGFAVIIDTSEIYLKVAFETLSDSFRKVGEKFGYEITNYFRDNKSAIIGGIAAGLATAFIPGASLVRVVAAATGVGVLSSMSNPKNLSTSELQERIYQKRNRYLGKSLDEENTALETAGDKDSVAYKATAARIKKLEADLLSYQKELDLRLEEAEKFAQPVSTPEQIKKRIDELKKANPPGTKYIPLEKMQLDGEEDTNKTSNSPTRIPQSLLDIIGKAEGSSQGYEATNKGKAGDNNAGRPGLTQMTVGEVMAAQAKKEFVAAGKYQIIPPTLKYLVDKKIVSKDDKFNKETQDKLATALIDAALKRAGSDTKKQQYELAKTFAAIADPNTNESYHKDVGNNKSSITTEQIQPILKNSGANISSLSSDMFDGLRALTLNSGEGSGSIINNYNTNVAGSSGSRQFPSAFSSDVADLFIKNTFAVTA